LIQVRWRRLPAYPHRVGRVAVCQRQPLVRAVATRVFAIPDLPRCTTVNRLGVKPRGTHPVLTVDIRPTTV